MSLEDIVKSLATNTLQFQQETKQFQQEVKANIQSLDNQMGQLQLVGYRHKGWGNYPLKR